MASHITRRLFSTTTRRMADQSLKDESKRNPETMVRPFFFFLSSHPIEPNPLGNHDPISATTTESDSIGDDSIGFRKDGRAS